MVIAVDLNDVIRDFTRQFKNQYQKHVDFTFDIEDKDIDNIDFSEIFPFKTKEEYNNFRYIDYPYEIYGRAEAMDKILPYRFNDWIQKDLRNVDEDKIPHVMYVSPFETALTIQSTMAFLAKLPSRVREIYFPIDSSTIWDRCDILITANPILIDKKPEGKICIKIEMPYNKEHEADYTFTSMMDVIRDEKDTIINLIEGSDA